MRASITTSCGTALAVATLLGCGGRDAPPPPVRSSPELVPVVVTSPVSVESDPRTGVVLDGERLARLQGNVLETLATFTRAPSPVWSLSVVRYFEDAAWVGSPDETIRVQGGVTTPFAATDCDPGTDGAGLQPLDSPASDAVWATSLGVPTGGGVPCHFAGPPVTR